MNKDLQMGFCDKCFQAQFWQHGKPQQAQECDEIEPGLWIGPKEAALSADMLKAKGIQNVMICCSHIPAYLPDTEDQVRYLRLAMADSLDQNLLHYLPPALEFIETALEKKQGVLVHCNAGVSRSGSVCVAFCMKKYKLDV